LPIAITREKYTVAAGDSAPLSRLYARRLQGVRSDKSHSRCLEQINQKLLEYRETEQCQIDVASISIRLFAMCAAFFVWPTTYKHETRSEFHRSNLGLEIERVAATSLSLPIKAN
jgi:hypothetical protein